MKTENLEKVSELLREYSNLLVGIDRICSENFKSHRNVGHLTIYTLTGNKSVEIPLECYPDLRHVLEMKMKTLKVHIESKIKEL